MYYRIEAWSSEGYYWFTVEDYIESPLHANAEAKATADRTKCKVRTVEVDINNLNIAPRVVATY